MKRIIGSILFAITIIGFNTSCKKNVSHPVVIIATCNGCDIMSTEMMVTYPIEKHLDAFGLKTESITTQGTCMITVDSKLTIDSIRHLVLDIRESLPQETQVDFRNFVDPNTQIVRYIISTDQMSIGELRKWNEEVMNEQLEASPKVIGYHLVGGGKPIIKIAPSNLALMQHELGLNDLVNGINEGWMELSTDKMSHIEQVGEIFIQQKCRLKDIADISLVEVSKEDIIYNSHPVLEGIVIFRQNMNAAEIKKEFEQILEKLKPKMNHISIIPFRAPEGWNNNQLTMTLEVCYPSGILWEDKTKLNGEINKALDDLNGIESVLTEVGYSANDNPIETDKLHIYLNITAGIKLEDVERDVMNKLDKFPGIEYSIIDKKMKTGQILIQGIDLEILIKTAGSIAESVRNFEGISSVRTEGVNSGPQISVEFDRNKLLEHGINMNEMNQMMHAKSRENASGMSWELSLTGDNSKMIEFEDWRIHTTRGLVPLSSFWKITMEKQYSSILHVNGQRTIKINFSCSNSDAFKKVKNWVNNPTGINWPKEIKMSLTEQ